MTSLVPQKTSGISSTTTKSKSILAQLLASEGIFVTHNTKAETASFDTKSRLLTLPTWENMSDALYDMLVGHEIGHALFTPFDEQKEMNAKVSGDWCADAQEIGGDSHGHIAQIYLNIVEDARIEKLIKEKYPGLKRDFVAAYDELLKRNVFGLNENNKPTHLLDRINLHFKLGVSGQQKLDISFSPAESVFVDRIENVQTYEEMVQIVRDVWDYETKQGQDPKKVNPKAKPGPENSERPGPENSESEELMEIDPNMEGDKRSGNHSVPKSQKNMDDNMKKMKSSKTPTSQNCLLPEPILENIIITPDEIHHLLHNQKLDATGNMIFQRRKDAAAKDSAKFVELSKKSVAHLLKQFEMKKAADAHKRTSIAKTGILDMMKMIHYKYNEDIFARNTVIKSGKNHGFVMFIDWSSSMGGIIDDTINQCFMIALFCKKANIPFEVYAFSDQPIRLEILVPGCHAYGIDRMTKDDFKKIRDENKPRIASWKSADGIVLNSKSHYYYDDTDEQEAQTEMLQLTPQNLSLLNFVSSSMSMKEMVRAYENMLLLTKNYPEISYCGQVGTTPRVLSLNGTPLEEAILAANEIVKRFRATNKLQVVNTIFLTDGMGSPMFNFNSLYGYGATDTISGKTFVIDKKHKKSYDVGRLLDLEGKSPDKCKKTYGILRSASFHFLLKLHKMLTGSNTIGFYVNSTVTFNTPYAVSTFVDIFGGNVDRLLKLKKQWKDEGFIVADPKTQMNGYDEMYVIRGSALDLETSEEMENLDAGISVAKIRNAFRKQLKSSAISRNLLNKFIDMVVD